jgi:proteic killer suppression protein
MRSMRQHHSMRCATRFDFHALRGKPQRDAILMNRPWCLTFEWENDNVRRVDLEQYR